MYDVVIPYITTRSTELLYVLRSLKNLPHRNVYIVGDRPRFNLKDVIFFKQEQTANPALNTYTVMNKICETSEVSDDFIWLADDIMITEPVKEIPIWHRGLIKDRIDSFDNRRLNHYQKRLINTYEVLKSRGIDEPLFYDMHIPFVFNKNKWLALDSSPEIKKMSLYGNTYQIGGEYHPDVKDRRGDNIPQYQFASSYDGSFNQGVLYDYITNKFKDKGAYEQ